jgi:hypothetical protein
VKRIVFCVDFAFGSSYKGWRTAERIPAVALIGINHGQWTSKIYKAMRA